MTARWWWVGFTDATRPKGEQALGAVVVKHSGPEHIIAADLIRLEIAPRGAWPLFGLIEAAWGDPPIAVTAVQSPPMFLMMPPKWPTGIEAHSKLLDNQEAEALAKAWDPGHRGLAGPDDIKRAFLDDEARDGDPLFRKGGS